MSRFRLELPANLDNAHMVQVLNDRLRRIGQAVAEATAGGSGDGVIAYNPDYTGAVTRTHWEKHGEDPSVLDWGAVGDGATDNTKALQTAINVCASRGVALRVPTGTYLATHLTLPSGAHLYGDGPTSIIRQRDEAGVDDVPFISNSDSANGNSDISIQSIKADGNSQNQTATRVDILNLKNVSGVHIDRCEFENAPMRCIAGWDWTDVRITDNHFENWLPVNVIDGDAHDGEYEFTGFGGAIQCCAEYGSGQSSGIKIAGNYVNGWTSHSTCIKLSGSLSNKVTDIIITGNTCLVGYESGEGGTLGIELWAPRAPTGLGFEHYTVSDNVIRAEIEPNLCFGISIAGAGGLYGAVTGNVVRGCNAYGIESASSSHLSITGNSVHGGKINVDTNYGGPCEHVVIANNTVAQIGEVDGYPTRSRFGIRLYNGKIGGASPHNIQNCIVTGNAVDITGTGQYGQGISLDVNDVDAFSRDNQITNNTIVGDGTVGQRAVGCHLFVGRLERTLIAFNTIRSVYFGVSFLGEGVDNRYFCNMFSDVEVPYTGTPGETDQIIDIMNTEGANFAPNAVHIRGKTYPTIDQSGNVCLGHPASGQHFSTVSDEEIVRNPNALFINQVNYSAETQGGIITSNSKFTGDPNWVKVCKDVEFTASVGTDTLLSVAHGFGGVETVYVHNSGGTLPPPLLAETTYYVLNSTADTLQLSETSGGEAIDIEATGDGTHYLTKSPWGLFLLLGSQGFKVGFDRATNAKGTGVGVPTPGTTGDRGALSVRPSGVYSDLPFFPQYAYGPGIYSGPVSPIDSQAAPRGSIYLQRNGHLWWKKSGTDSSGWVALTGIWELVDSELVGTDYKVQIYDASNTHPVQFVVRANGHIDQHTTPIILTKSAGGNTLNRMYGDGNTDLVSLGVGYADNRTSPRDPGFVLIGNFLGVGTDTQVGSEVVHVVGDSLIEGDVDLDGDMKLVPLTATRPLKVDGGKLIISDLIDLASSDDVTGTLPVANGGTGAVNAAGARTSLDLYSTAQVYTKAEVDAAISAALPDTADSAGSHDHGGAVSPDGSHTHSLS